MVQKKNPSPFVVEIKDEVAIKKLLTYCEDSGFTISQPPHTRFQAKKTGLSCTFYNSGKLVVAGKEKDSFVEFYLEPEIIKTFTFTHAKFFLDLTPRIGVDESGKGDFFGALCVAGVYAEGDAVQKLADLGAKDSKSLKDLDIIRIAKGIRKNFTHHIIRLNPLKYNELYNKFGNLNTLLGWCHATIIEQLVEKSGCRLAIVDQFASKGLMEKLIRQKNLDIDLTQRTKAESDVVVAAASILARAAFVEGLENLEKTFGMTFPKGASEKVLQAGKKFVGRYGSAELSKVSKVHFKTTNKLVERLGDE